MALIPVRFEYLTGLRPALFDNARLSGNWDARGLRSETWSSTPMEAFTAEDGCPAFRATVRLDDSQLGQSFRWGVTADAPQRADAWAIPTEVGDAGATERHRLFTLRAAGQVERYYLTHCRRLGANKLSVAGQPAPAIRFAVWAPNARATWNWCAANRRAVTSGTMGAASRRLCRCTAPRMACGRRRSATPPNW